MRRGATYVVSRFALLLPRANVLQAFANQSTPWLGVWQRINIAAYMVQIAVLAIRLLRSRAPAGPTDGPGAARATAMAA